MPKLPESFTRTAHGALAFCEENRMTQFEQCLVDILAELTDAERSTISLTDTLDQQGVDSLVALRLARGIHAARPVERAG